VLTTEQQQNKTMKKTTTKTGGERKAAGFQILAGPKTFSASITIKSEDIFVPKRTQSCIWSGVLPEEAHSDALRAKKAFYTLNGFVLCTKTKEPIQHYKGRILQKLRFPLAYTTVRALRPKTADQILKYKFDTLIRPLLKKYPQAKIQIEERPTGVLIEFYHAQENGRLIRRESLKTLEITVPSLTGRKITEQVHAWLTKQPLLKNSLVFPRNKGF
jgi:hypothetical protein